MYARKCALHAPLRYEARLWYAPRREEIYLGAFATPEEAALIYARCLGREAARAAADAIRGVCDEAAVQLSPAQALSRAAEEGLELLPSASASGYRGVAVLRNGRCVAKYHRLPLIAGSTLSRGVIGCEWQIWGAGVLRGQDSVDRRVRR